jgi:hypothetical protein
MQYHGSIDPHRNLLPLPESPTVRNRVGGNPSFTFVTGYPPSELARREIQSLIRAHASRASRTNPQDLNYTSEQRRKIEAARKRPLVWRENLTVAKVKEPMYAPPSPQTVLGQGRVNPFDTINTSNASIHEQELLDFGMIYLKIFDTVQSSCITALNVAGPRLVPQNDRNLVAASPIKRTIATMFMESSSAYHVLLSVLPAHLSSLRQVPISQEDQNFALEHEGIALRSLIREIAMLSHTKAPVSDILLFTIAVLATHTNCGRMRASLPLPYPPSPLAMAQDLHLHARCCPDERHIAALFNIIDKQGGLEKVELYGIREIIELSAHVSLCARNSADDI